MSKIIKTDAVGEHEPLSELCGNRSVNITIKSVEVTAKPRKLRLSMRKVVRWRGKKMVFILPWTVESVQNIQSQHGLDVEEELCRLLQEEIWKEITAESGYTRNDLDNELLAKIRAIKADLDSEV